MDSRTESAIIPDNLSSSAFCTPANHFFIAQNWNVFVFIFYLSYIRKHFLLVCTNWFSIKSIHIIYQFATLSTCQKWIKDIFVYIKYNEWILSQIYYSALQQTLGNFHPALIGYVLFIYAVEMWKIKCKQGKSLRQND